MFLRLRVKLHIHSEYGVLLIDALIFKILEKTIIMSMFLVIIFMTFLGKLI